MKYRVAFVVVLVGFLCALPVQAVELRGLKINTSIKPPFSTERQDGFFDLLLKQLFARLNIDFSLLRLPSERALHMVNDGFSDGVLPRIAGMESRYPNLIMVPEPVVDYNFVAFMHQPASQDIGWEQLASQSVGMIIGWKIYENNVPASAKVSKVSSPGQLFQLLAGDRVSVILYERYAGHYLLKMNRYEGIAECHPPLAVRPMFLYLHKAHADMIEKVAAELRKMKEDGTWRQIASETLERECVGD